MHRASSPSDAPPVTPPNGRRNPDLNLRNSSILHCRPYLRQTPHARGMRQFRSVLKGEAGCPTLAASLSLRLGWDATNPNHPSPNPPQKPRAPSIRPPRLPAVAGRTNGWDTTNLNLPSCNKGTASAGPITASKRGGGFTACGKTLGEKQEVSGHDFSRAVSR
jgi:hypothetical protein